ncbi:alpha/beta fold hydrolase [Robiginitalea sp. SC105]|uniref:alpha/beta hydrolase family protein n=1 Tax=Robiginitalea sp. SC105 TaxID=2762332 RepID=UPI001639AA6D|nr:alpha/beta fold hydrolase [Robiginitalea sp. SC105]MBC2839758.1 alpha/beta fold hydrolase [Robiginitalea sp. SC105]
MTPGEAIRIPTPAGHRLAGTLFRPEGNGTGHSILISSATGMLQKFYFSYARHFASLGYTVLTFDYWGIGDSGGDPATLRANPHDLIHWGSNDQTAATRFLSGMSPGSNITLVTHSIGGQLAGFNQAHELLGKIILVASQSGYWNHYSHWHKIKMWAFWHLMIPGLSPLFGYFPAKKLGLFENLPKNMVYQWNRWGKHPEYLNVERESGAYHFGEVRAPVLSLSFPGDPLAPVEAVDWLNAQYRAAALTRVHYTEEGLKPGHFGYFREAFRDTLWSRTHNWILNDEWGG